MSARNYQGMSYEAASAEAGKLLREAIDTGHWFHLPECLMQLRAIMQPVSDKQAKLELG